MNKHQLLQTIKFVLQSVAAGLALAFVLIYCSPQPPGAEHEGKRADAGQDQAPGRYSYSTAVDAVSPAVVNIYATTIRQQRLHPLFQDPLFQRFFGMPEPAEDRNNTLGSGVIMSNEGYLLTNAHVISQADEITVSLHDGRRAQASIIGIDAETDLAVLKIPMNQLTPAPLADSAQVRTGDVVLAIGNPYDLGHTVSQGIVSAIGRNRLGITTFEDFIQTDASINPGNSGGALINAAGRLIGINTAIARSGQGIDQAQGQWIGQGIGFAIPINLARRVMRQLIDQGYVLRGWLGIEAQVLPQDMASDIANDAAGAADAAAGGVLVAGVLNGGPAADAGIRPGDILISVNGQPLHNPQHAINLIAGITPDTPITIEVLRGWRQLSVEAVVAQRPALAR